MSPYHQPLQIEPVKYGDEQTKRDGLIKETQKARSREGVDRSLDKEFGKRPRAKYPDYDY